LNQNKNTSIAEKMLDVFLSPKTLGPLKIRGPRLKPF